VKPPKRIKPKERVELEESTKTEAGVDRGLFTFKITKEEKIKKIV
jgi:hypothetical protein